MNYIKIRVFVSSFGLSLFLTANLCGQGGRSADMRAVDARATVLRPVETDSPGSGSLVARASQAVIPRLIKFSGALHDAAGKPLTGTVDVTFSLYSAEAGGDALWFETQSVQADELGRYTALLGAMHADGLPMELFTSGEVRWLGIQVGHEGELQPRVLLVSVPYALKAGDAETLGGKPASAFMLSTQTGTALAIASSASTASATQPVTSGRKQMSKTANSSVATPCTSVTSDGTATVNSIALFTTACNLESSNLVQSSGNLGFGTTTPQARLHIFGPTKPDSDARFNFILGDSSSAAAGYGGGIQFSGYYSGTSLKAGFANIRGVKENNIQGNYASALIFDTRVNGGNQTERMRITSAGNVGIGTTALAHKLDVAGDINASSAASVVVQGTNTNIGSVGQLGVNMVCCGGTGVFGTGAAFGVYGSTPTASQFRGGVVGADSATGATGLLGTLDGSGRSTGVYGWVNTSNGRGLVGWNNNLGSLGEIATEVGGGPTGVYGNGSTYGIYGTGGAYGVYANGSTYGLYGSASQSNIGVYGISAFGYGVYGNGDNGVRGEVTSGDTTGTGVAGIGGSAGDGIYGDGGAYGVYSASKFAAAGTKSAVVALPDNRVVELYSMESPDVWFEDFGTATLKNGVAELTMESTFLLTVNTKLDYHVFLTPRGDCEGLYVANQTENGFQVRELRNGRSNITFDYRIVAKRRGFETVRLREVDADAEAVAAIREQNQVHAQQPTIRIPRKK